MKNDESFGNYCENCEKRKASPNCEQTKKFGLAFKLQMENTHEYFVGYFQKGIPDSICEHEKWYVVFCSEPSQQTNKKNTNPIWLAKYLW